MDISVVTDRILLTPIKEEDKVTAAGLVIPNTRSAHVARGTVVAIGSEVKEKEPQIKVGSVILYYNVDTGVPFELEGVDYVVLKLGQVYCVINSEKN